MSELNETPNGADEPRPRGRDRRHQTPGRQHRVNLRFGDQEHADVTDAATAAGLTASGFCADAAVTAARGEPGPGSERRVLRRLGIELFAARSAVNRFGSNVNQVAAAWNTTGVLPEYARAAIDMCRRAVERLDAVVAELRRRIG